VTQETICNCRVEDGPSRSRRGEPGGCGITRGRAVETAIMSSAAVELADWSFDTTRTQMRGEDDIGQGGIAPRPRHLTLRGRLGWSYRVRATP